MQRNTTQRRAIKKAFLQAGRPLAPQEVADLVQETRKIGIATVYRNIKLLVSQAWLTPVEIPGEPSRYEVRGHRHHHHFFCRECQKVYDIEGCPGNLDALTPPGFVLDDHEVFLYGRCSDCSKVVHS